MRLTLAAALAGGADATAFAYSRRAVMRSRPQRAAGTAVAIGVWLGLAASAATGARGRARALATTALALNGLMLGVHLRAGIAAPRVWLGCGLAATALAGTLAGADRGAG